jgi:hypothetical protein
LFPSGSSAEIISHLTYSATSHLEKGKVVQSLLSLRAEPYEVSIKHGAVLTRLFFGRVSADVKEVRERRLEGGF